MNRKEMMIEYVNLRIQEYKDVEPYYQLLGDSLQVYETISRADDFICKLLNIDDFIDESIILDFVYWVNTKNDVFRVLDENEKVIETVEELVDYILREEE